MSQEVAHILDHADARSLVLVDELGRSTSNADGVAISWAVSRLKNKAWVGQGCLQLLQSCSVGQ